MKSLKDNMNTRGMWDARYSVDKLRIFPYERVYEEYLNRLNRIKAIVDYGCGTGEGINYLSEQPNLRKTKFTGLDFSMVAINKAKKLYPHMRFEGADFNNNDVIEGNVALILQTLEHIDNPVEFVDKVSRVSDQTVISVPIEDEPGGEHFHTFTKSDFDIFFPRKVIEFDTWMLIILGRKT